MIVGAVRSPIGRGREGGELADLHPVESLSQTLQGLIGRTGVDPGTVEDLVVGCVTQCSEQSGNDGRMARLTASYPEAVASVTIERKCGSGTQAIQVAAGGVMAGHDLVIAADGGHFGLQAICEAGGTANAAVIERIA